MKHLELSAEPAPKALKVVLVSFILLCVLGIISAWHLAEVFRQTHVAPEEHESFCNISEGMNCDEVALHDEFSVVLGTPVAVWAVAGYLFVALLALTALLRARSQFGLGFLFLFGVLFVAVSIWLVYVMHFEIGTWCIVCLGIDVVNLSLFGLSLTAVRNSKRTIFQSVASDFKNLMRMPLQSAGLAVVGLGLLAAAWFSGQKLQAWIAEERAARQITQKAEGASALPQMLYVSQKDERLAEDNWSKKTQDTPKDEACRDQNSAAPAAPVSAIAVGISEEGYHWKGAVSPVLEIHEFTDFECPYCRNAHMLLNKLVSRYSGQLRVYHRHLPLDNHCNSKLEKPFHPRACELSLIAVCAAQQGRFWETADYLFHNAQSIRAQNLSAEDIAKALELDLGKFNCCMDDPESMRTIQKDLFEAWELNLRGTPAYRINGQVYYGKIPDDALKLLDAPKP